jgi:hypothetical protein
MLSNSQVGTVGLILYSAVFIVCTWRLLIHYFPYYSPWYETRKLVHIMLWTYSLLQSLSFTVFIYGSETYNKWCYSCHLFSIWTEVVAFSSLSYIWSTSLLSEKKSRIYFIPSLLLVDFLFLLYIIVLVVEMFLSHKNFESWSDDSKVFACLLIVEPVVLTINGFFLGIIGLLILQKLSIHPSMSKLDRIKKNQVKCRLVVCVLVCCISFGVRSVFELLLFLNRDGKISNDVWWIASTWCPTILPALMFLYALVKSHISVF